MFFYFECKTCKQVSELFTESERPGAVPKCVPCSTKHGSSIVETRSVNYFTWHCRRCDRTSGMCTADDYPTLKGARPVCMKCHKSDAVFIVKPQVSGKPARMAKRKELGVLGKREWDDLDLYDDTTALELEALEEGFRGGSHKKPNLALELESADKLPRAFVFGPTDPNAHLARSEATYQEKKRFRERFKTKNGALPDKRNPLKTELHDGTVVALKRYRDDLTSEETVGTTVYPKMNKSAPTVVNAAKLADRSLPWDYRELGPNSFLRRLCSLLYVVEFNGGGDGNNPVELQALWANGSLFLSTNNLTFSTSLLAALKTEGSVKAFLAKVDLKGTLTGGYKTAMRNFGKEHTEKLPVYQAEFGSEKYPDYFRFKWEYVFQEIQRSLKFAATDIEELVVAKSATQDGFKHWSVESPVVSGKVYVVLPKKKTKGEGDTYFTKKKIHAEELFHPILMALDGAGLLSEVLPAFVGGVKTPCRTCSMVLEDAATTLGTKLILPTNAFGHYWKASGMHVPSPVFPPNVQTMVFGSKKSIDDGSINIYNTEMPPSPKRDD
ncbi:hypothetical protein D7Y13_02115 [Corallococcus praedator]|uniref:Zinc ribbon domain-containing protein n=1 Tax=Corallococcus praedator TaxID=2316724 RepID=A0ABX9QQK9_9BACT|nr:MULTISPECIES: hypothetical protein [Corallococcus]RKH34842.1 hypothetical protein D7X75_06505 [Corallococcus sp. CA031C]RKI16755.1 hypothetical protein D7Y13_02115 [Corallococcus praedator]